MKSPLNVEKPEDAGVEPAVSECASGGFRIVEIALHHAVGPYPDPTQLAERQRPGSLIDYLDLNARPHRANLRIPSRRADITPFVQSLHPPDTACHPPNRLLPPPS